jgi:hypothetical protein
VRFAWAFGAVLASSLLFGCAVETEGSDQVEEVTGLPQRAIRTLRYDTADNAKVLIEIEYYYDRIGVSELTAAAPTICARRGMVVDKLFRPTGGQVSEYMQLNRFRLFGISCR